VVLQAERVERIAEALTANAEAGRGPLPSVLAATYGIPVLPRTLEPGVKVIANTYVREIHYDPLKVSGRELEFGIAHELIELELELSGLLSPTDHEHCCDRGGRAVMMPRDFFREVLAGQSSADLFELARLFSETPVHQIGFRLADLYPGYVVSVWDGCRREGRVASADVNLDRVRSVVEWAELEALKKVYHHGKARRVANHPSALGTAWRINAVNPNQAVVVCRLTARSAWSPRDHLVLEYDPGARR